MNSLLKGEKDIVLISLWRIFITHLASLFHRHALEIFFSTIVKIYKSESESPITVAIKLENALHKTAKIDENLRAAFPKMSLINDLLKKKDIRAAVWKEFSFDEDCFFPDLPKNLLYGGIPDTIFSPTLGVSDAIVSNMSAEDTECSFEEVSDSSCVDYGDYDDDSSSDDNEIHGSSEDDEDEDDMYDDDDDGDKSH